MLFMRVRLDGTRAVIIARPSKRPLRDYVEFPIATGDFKVGRTFNAYQLAALKTERRAKITDFKYEGAGRWQKAKPSLRKPLK